MAHKYHIKDAITKTAAHHESYKQLWETKWKKFCEMGVYPFMFGSVKDFEPIVEELVKQDFKEPYDWDTYAKMYFPKAEELASRAEEAEKAGETEKACELYLRSSAVYRIARFPSPRSEQQRYAWKKGQRSLLQGRSVRIYPFEIPPPVLTQNSLLEHPVSEVLIPHTHGIEGEGEVIPVSFNLPSGASAESPVPCILIITGLDGYRTELAVWQKGWSQRGVASVIAEIPGTGDSPALRNDPTSPDRQWSSLLDWIDTQKEIDNKKVVVWGFSTGGYYSLRMAHTHKDRLMACIVLGGGAHHMFDREWLSEVNHLEYPFDLAGALTYKFGYGNDLEKFIVEAPKFSLLNDGTLDKPCTKVFLVNGDQDEIFPIEDLYIALEHGGPKLARVVPGTKHMGEPQSFFIILAWIYGLLGIKGAPVEQMKTIPMRCKY